MIESVIEDPKKAKFVAIWNVNNFVPMLRSDETLAASRIDFLAIELAIYDLIAADKISSTNAKTLFRELITQTSLPDVEQYATDKGYIQMSDASAVVAIVDQVLADPRSAVAIQELKNGNDKVIGYLIGQVMKSSSGQANPALAKKIIRERILN